MKHRWMKVCNNCSTYYEHTGNRSDLGRCRECGAQSWDTFWICPKCNNHNDSDKKSCYCGYKIESGGCFITTAVMTSIGKNDNCYELELFRNYRDLWLNTNYPELIQEYYRIAPNIVKKIDTLHDKNDIYKFIWNKYLNDCSSLLVLEKFEEVKSLYINMVCDLKEKYYECEMDKTLS